MIHKLLSGLALALVLHLPCYSAEPVSASFFGNAAIGGKDTVSYHAADVKQSRAVKEGDKRYEVMYLGAKWLFATIESADKFRANPALYVPTYNGYCANALSEGEGLVKTDGAVWQFFGDRLYLFYAESGRQRWLQGDWMGYQKQADAAWQVLRSK